jgi:hypothetical protein
MINKQSKLTYNKNFPNRFLKIKKRYRIVIFKNTFLKTYLLNYKFFFFKNLLLLFLVMCNLK